MGTRLTEYIKRKQHTQASRVFVGVAIIVSLLLISITSTSHTKALDDVLTSEQRQIALKIQCPICPGESIADSQADVARNMLAKLIELSNANKTEQEILDYFVQRYGLVVLRSPPKTGFTLGLWLFPPIVLIVGLSTLAYFLRSQNIAMKHPRPTSEPSEDVKYQGLIEEQVRHRKDQL
jgi:cytochrome c-type biogenesis protein CcmH